MKFCPECGSKVEGMKFCPECGYNIGNSAQQSVQQPSVQQSNSQIASDDQETVICKFETKLLIGSKFEKNILGDVNLSRSKEKYTLTTERLIIEQKGIVRSKTEEIQGYKIMDIQVKQGIFDKSISVGDITIISSDKTTPRYVLKNIENPNEIVDKIRQMVRNAKRGLNVVHHQHIPD